MIHIKRRVLSLNCFELEHKSANQPHHSSRNIFHHLSFMKDSCINTWIPIVSWLPKYDFRSDLLSDLIAGITIVSLHIPQALAFSSLCHVDPINSIFTSFIPVLVYIFLGTSKHVSMGQSAFLFCHAYASDTLFTYRFVRLICILLPKLNHQMFFLSKLTL